MVHIDVECLALKPNCCEEVSKQSLVNLFNKMRPNTFPVIHYMHLEND